MDKTGAAKAPVFLLGPGMRTEHDDLVDAAVRMCRAFGRLNSPPPRPPAAEMTLEALMYSLRERGVVALDEPDTRRRLKQLNDEQLIRVGQRLPALQLGLGAWTIDQIEALMRLHKELA